MADRSQVAEVVAAFDFDGTLTRGDTLLPFLRRVCGPARTWLALTVGSFRIIGSLRDGATRGSAKESVLARLLKDMDAADLAADAEAFAARLVERGLQPWVRDRLAWHRALGHLLVLVSASPEVVVAPVGRLLGFDAVLGTRLEVGPDGRLTGRMEGLNCRGPEKAHRLQAWMGGDAVLGFAYGDSAGDRELLALAQVPIRVRRRSVPSLGE